MDQLPLIGQWVSVESLSVARATFEKTLDEEGSALCPCCGKQSRIYKRRLHAEMALWLMKLVTLYQESGGVSQTTVSIMCRGGWHLRAGGTNGTLLVHWGLIESATAENAAGAPVGEYRPTTRGCWFVDRSIRVPAWVLLRDNRKVGASDDMVDIVDVLGKRFDYQQLLNDLRKK